ncbi:MAG: hypothetical protein ACYCOR_20385 [Acidobacteriaceae bacterium]
MNAEAIANLLDAKRVGRDRWIAKCPSHSDRRPSLQISQGRSGVLLKCWSHGCTPSQILAAVGLSMRDLFDAPLTPEQRKQAAHAKAVRNEQERQQRAIDRAQRDRIFKLEKLRICLKTTQAFAKADERRQHR